MLTLALALAVTATVAYHLVTKLMPAGAHPIATLLALGWLYFKDRLTATHLAGVVLCLAGLGLVNRD